MQSVSVGWRVRGGWVVCEGLARKETRIVRICRAGHKVPSTEMPVKRFKRAPEGSFALPLSSHLLSNPSNLTQPPDANFPEPESIFPGASSRVLTRQAHRMHSTLWNEPWFGFCSLFGPPSNHPLQRPIVSSKGTKAPKGNRFPAFFLISRLASVSRRHTCCLSQTIDHSRKRNTFRFVIIRNSCSLIYFFLFLVASFFLWEWR